MKPFYDHAGITIYHGDCRELLPCLTADVVITDPPYNAKGIGLPQKQYIGGAFSMTTEAYKMFCSDWFQLCMSITERMGFTPGTRHLWCYPPARWVAAWYKPGAVAYTGLGGFNIWEPILIYGSSPSRLTSDVYTLTPQNLRTGPEKEHPCPKPLPLLRWLVGGLSADNEVCLDPFMGSGTTLVAAKHLGRRGIGVEVEERYCEIAAKRLSQEVFDLSESAKAESERVRELLI